MAKGERESNGAIGYNRLPIKLTRGVWTVRREETGKLILRKAS